MQIPLEMSFREVPRTKELEDIITARVGKLEQFCERITGCRVAVERRQKHQTSGSPYRVRIDLTAPPHDEIVIRREPGEGDMHDPLEAVIHDAFDACERKLKKHEDILQGDVKHNPHKDVTAVVDKIFKNKGYGFLKTDDGREIYFHENSVLHGKFDTLRVGDGVNFTEEMGEKGPQAVTVRVVYKHNI